MATATARFPDLEGKVALVTGGSRGLGAAAARLLAANGVRVAVNGRDREALARVVAEVPGAVAAPGDCTDPEAMERVRGEAERWLGPVELLVAFAGGGGRGGPTHEMSLEAWRAAIESNLTATFITLKTFLPGMIQRRRGAIVTMSSSAGRQPAQSSAAYAAAKAGIQQLTRHVANEVGPQGVRVNCLAPGAIVTEDFLGKVSPEKREEIAQLFPLRRLGTPEEVAVATAYLLSEAAAFVTGVTLDIAGGKVMM